MSDPNHGSSIITRLRLITEELYSSLTIPGYRDASHVRELHARAENLLPIANVDDIEVIVLREAAAILNGRGLTDLADSMEAVADEVAAEMAADAAR